MVQGAISAVLIGAQGPTGVQGVIGPVGPVGPQGVAGTAGRDLIGTPYPIVETRLIGGRIAQIVETRADGTKNTSTLTYVGDQLTVLRQDNPAKTYTFTYTGTTLTGWSVA